MKLALRDNNSILKRPWLLVSIAISFIAMVVMMLGFHYTDSDAYITWSVELLDCVFGKTDVEFYEYSVLNPRCDWPLTCDKTIPMLIPLAVWNFPVWVVHQITGEMYVNGTWEIAWMKLGFAACAIWIAVECSRIVKKVRPDSDSLLVYPLIFGSADLLISTMYAGQDEIVYLAAFVAAMRCLIYDKRIPFVIFSSIAVALCPEMLLPVLILIVFHEKRIWAIALEVICSYIPSAVFSFAYRNNETFHKYSMVQPSLMKELFNTGISFDQTIGVVPLFIIVFCLLLFYSFTKKNIEENKYDMIWIMAVLMTSLTLLASGGLMDFFYRSLLYVPFVVMLIVASRQKLETNLILFGLYSWVRVWLCCLNNFPQNMSSHYLSFENEFTQRLQSYYGYLVLSKFIGSKMSVMLNTGVFSAVCIALAIVIFTVNYKSRQDREIVILKLNKDIITLIVGLAMPLLLVAFGFMCYRTYQCTYSNNYYKYIRFGDCYREDPEELITEYGYINGGNIDIYPRAIVYGDNVCSSMCNDAGGYRHVYSGGMTYGPYLLLCEGDYQISIYGMNMTYADFDITYLVDGVPYTIDKNNIEVTDSRISYEISLEESVSNVEIRVFNNNTDDVAIEAIEISGGNI